jgi:hypothetical protein
MTSRNCPPRPTSAEKGIWTRDEQAEAWHRHRFYRFQPDLNTDHPAVRAELHKIMAFLDPNSLLTWFERMPHTRRECEEIGPASTR